jgi:hypothetical protein
LPYLIGQGLPPLYHGWIVDALWLAEEASLLLQQRSGLRRSGTQCMRRFRDALVQRRRAIRGQPEMPV